MSYTATAISTATTSTASWKVKYKDLRKANSDQTGIIGDHQVHVTVTNLGSRVNKIGWHISVYQLGADGHLLNAYSDVNLVARIWCWPNGEGKGKKNPRWSRWGTALLDPSGQLLPNPLSVSNMKGYAAWEEKAWDFFFELFPKYMEAKKFIPTANDFPALAKSTASSSSAASASSASSS